MRLFAAIVPPRDVLEEVDAAVDSVQPGGAPEPVSRRRWRSGRRGGAHLAGRPAGVPAPHPELDRPPLDELIIPITGFGNVTLGDSVRLADALRTAVAGWSRPQVAFTGAAALEFTGDQSVWATLSGDLDALGTIGRGVPQVVQRLGFFVDRRKFRPWLSVGTITDETTAPYLERVVAALEALQGRTWRVEDVALMQRPADGSSTTKPFEVMERLPLAEG